MSTDKKSMPPTNAWAEGFLGDVEYEARGPWGHQHETYMDYLRTRDLPYPVGLYTAMRMAYYLFGRSKSWIRHPRITPEIVAALGSPPIIKAARDKQQNLTEYRRVLMDVLDSTTELKPRQLAKALKLALAVTP